MRVTGHQPSLLPYLGFWSKAAACNRFILLPHYQLSYNNREAFTHRCRIGTDESYVHLTLPIHHSMEGRFPLLISESKLKRDHLQERWNKLDGRLSATRHWKFIRKDVQALWFDSACNNMGEFNIKMIYYLARLMQLTTEFIVHDAVPAGDTPTCKIQSWLETYGASEYVSGVNGRHYLVAAELRCPTWINDPVLPENLKTVSVVSSISVMGLGWTVDAIHKSVRLFSFMNCHV